MKFKLNLNKKTSPEVQGDGIALAAEQRKTAQERAEARSARVRYTPAHLRPGKRRLSRKELLIVTVPALAAILAVVIVLVTVNHGSVYKFQDTACQYYGGSFTRITAGSELRRGTDGATNLKMGKQSITTTLPAYLDNSRKAVLSTDMLYVAPRSMDFRRAACFSEVDCRTNGMVYITRDGSTENMDPGFLYDGKDFYLFLEPVTVRFNGYTMELPALSYVEAVYGGYMMLFNYDTKEFFIEQSDGTGTAGPASGDYTVSLLGDSMTLNGGSKLLLATRPELFDPVV